MLRFFWFSAARLAGRGGWPGGISFNDFNASYLIGSIALAVILFESGLKTDLPDPSGFVAFSGIGNDGRGAHGQTGESAAVWLFSLSWTQALLIGAVLALTDVAAVNTLLRAARVAVPERV